jgi:hypothetical protein
MIAFNGLWLKTSGLALHTFRLRDRILLAFLVWVVSDKWWLLFWCSDSSWIFWNGISWLIRNCSSWLFRLLFLERLGNFVFWSLWLLLNWRLWIVRRFWLLDDLSRWLL